MVDYEVLTAALLNYGHKVERVIDVPKNAGNAEFIVDGRLLTLVEARQLLEEAEAKAPKRTS